MKKEIKNYLNKFSLEYTKSKNKFYFIEKYKILITAVFAFIGFLLGIIGFLFEGKTFLVSITSALGMFSLSFPENYNRLNFFLLFSALFIIITLFSAALFTFFQEFVNKYIAKKIIENNHIAIFGLGDINRAFLNSDFKNNEAIIIEADMNNKYIKEYREKGFGVIIGDVLNSEQLEFLNYETMHHAIIALGNDRINIELAIKMIEKMKKLEIKTPTRLIVHISNSELKEIFHQEFILDSKNSEFQIDVKTFSFYEECSKSLFDNNILISTSQLQSHRELKSIILGNGNLAISIIRDILLLSNFPNKNKHIIFIIEKNAKAFFQQIELATFYNKEKFPTIEFRIIKNDFKKVSFFKEEIFFDNNLSNIYICYDDEEINLNLAIELNDKIYVRNNDLNTKIYLGMFNEFTLSEKINYNYKSFARFNTFGNMSEIFSKDKLIDEKNYTIAKMIHNGYGDEFKKDNLTSIENLNSKWFKNIKYSDKLSNIAQSKHIDIKLQALGLTKQKSNKESNILIKENQKIFDKIIEPLMLESFIDYETIHKASLELSNFWNNKAYEVIYNPTKFETLFEKLIECEHERWNSFHYLNGWEYNIITDKNIKYHNCLKPLKAFSEKELQITILYDIYAILYIPNYLASAGWELKENSL